MRQATVAGIGLLGVAALLASAGCAHRAADGPTREEAAARADSVRAATERARSSATQTATFTDAERRRFTRVEEMIRARFAGVQVFQRGSSYAIRIRGAGSFGSTNEPLVLVDGATRSVADLRGVDPKDVARIEIVKDAVALYGSRGGNGVILVTTLRAP